MASLLVLRQHFQLNVFYNLDSGAFSQGLQHAAEKEAFSLDVAVAEEADHNHMLLSICTRSTLPGINSMHALI